MENHPIPQDVTGFQFKLIGEMTVKQFAYIAVGVIIAWIIFSLPLFTLIKIPLALLIAGLGAALAFVPIEGRPMDLMIANFFKAVFSPTEYLYQKYIPQGVAAQAQIQNPNQQNIAPIKTLYDNQLRDAFKKIPKKLNKLDQKEAVFFQNLGTISTNSNYNPVPVAAPAHMFADKSGGGHIPSIAPQPVQKAPESKEENMDFKKTAELLERELMQVKRQEAAQSQNQVDPKAYLEAHQKVLDLQKQLNEMLSQKQQLEQHLVELQKNMQQKTPVFAPSIATDVPKETKNVRSIPAQMAKSAGIPNPSEFPNVLTGIVKDPRGNPLPNILVEVKDEEGNAVRAFKTNALGHFASATPLINGNFTIDFEDPNGKNRFDSVGFSATGQIIMPIEVISVDEREELRRTLFN